MTFGPHHYVPVLKVKRGEKAALLSIDPRLRQHITPLLEIVERNEEKTPTVEGHLDKTFKRLAESVCPYTRCFLDAREIASDGRTAASKVFGRAATDGIVFTPVTGISRSADVAAVMRHRNNGLAIRLTREEFEQGGIASRLRAFVNQHDLKPRQTDLIMDLGAVNDLIADGIAGLTAAFLAEVPEHHSWRTFTLSACAFPSSMSDVPRHGHALVERDEWIAWRDGLHARRHALARLPTFSDCAIQHSKGVEGFDPRTMQASAAIRYALADAWLLIKGESTRQVRPGEQFPELAAQLVHGHLSSHFAGKDHCQGCRSVEAAAEGAANSGSLEAWRRFGTIHHVTTVVESLASLSWTAGSS